jgi:hypothetical protein
VYFTIMQSKKLYAWEAGPVDDRALALFCGDNPDFKASLARCCKESPVLTNRSRQQLYTSTGMSNTTFILEPLLLSKHYVNA